GRKLRGTTPAFAAAARPDCRRKLRLHCERWERFSSTGKSTVARTTAPRSVSRSSRPCRGWQESAHRARLLVNDSDVRDARRADWMTGATGACPCVGESRIVPTTSLFMFVVLPVAAASAHQVLEHWPPAAMLRAATHRRRQDTIRCPSSNT